MNYIFIGGTYRGFKVLECLVHSGTIPSVCFILKQDKHEVLKYSAEIIKLLKKNRIPYFLRRKLYDKDYKYIMDNYFEFGIVCGWRTIIKTKILKNFKFGLIAAHDSLLPKYRGFAPLNWAVINGEKETGVTLFLMNEGVVDSGNIIFQRKVSIGDNEYAIDVYDKITKTTVELYRDFFNDYKNNAVKLYKQDENQATYTCKRIPEDGRIDWKKSSIEVFNLIRGLAHPYPGAFCYYKKEARYIRKAEIGENNSRKYVGCIRGRVVGISEKGIEVLCGSGSIIIKEWGHKPGGKVECASKSVRSLSTTLM